MMDIESQDTRVRRGSGTPVALLEPEVGQRQEVRALLAQHPDLDVRVLRDAGGYDEIYAGTAGPHVLLVGLDSDRSTVLAEAAQILAAAPLCRMIVYGPGATVELLPVAMAMGARRYVPSPLDADALHQAIAEVAAEVRLLHAAAQATPGAAEGAHPATIPTPRAPTVVAVYSPKGGVGTTTLAVNVACALGTRGHRVALLDGNISFGNVGILLGLPPRRSIVDVVTEAPGIEGVHVEEALAWHRSGVAVLHAPPSPEQGEHITAEHLRAILALLRQQADFVVVDTWSSYDERTLAMLEAADRVLVPTTPELQAIKNLTVFLRVAELLGYPDAKFIPVLMRADSVDAGYVRDLERALERPFAARVISDGKRVTQSVIKGEPVVLAAPEAPVSQDLYALARLLDDAVDEADAGPRARSSWTSSLFRRRRAS